MNPENRTDDVQDIRDLAEAYSDQGRWQDALEAYKKAIALEPADADLHNGLGMVYEKVGQPEQAEQAYRQAIALSPTDAVVYYHLGTLLEQQKHIPRAIQAYEQCLRYSTHPTERSEVERRLAGLRSETLTEPSRPVYRPVALALILGILACILGICSLLVILQFSGFAQHELPFLWGTTAVVTLAPENTADVTPESLKSTAEILQKRLDAALERPAKVTVQERTLRVQLASRDDIPFAIDLATAVGAVTFFDSADPIALGAPVPVDAQVILTDTHVAQARMTKDRIGGWEIALTFGSEGTRRFAEYTTANTGRFLVIALDGSVIYSPQVMSPIPDGHAVISGSLDKDERVFLMSLAAMLTSGRLPLKLVLLDRTP